jgi:hypothetical protein
VEGNGRHGEAEHFAAFPEEIHQVFVDGEGIVGTVGCSGRAGPQDEALNKGLFLLALRYNVLFLLSMIQLFSWPQVPALL